MSQPVIEPRQRASLVPAARNPRTHDAKHVAQIAASIQRWGWTMPVLIDGAGNIIAGHGRVLAAEKLGIDEVPCVVVDGWTDEERRAYLLADNQLALNSGWDREMLELEMRELDGLNVDLSTIGFDAAAIDRLLGRKGTEDEVPVPPAVAVTQPGDLITLGAHRLLCGDSTRAEDVEHLLAGTVPLLMVTDPPYGVDYDPEWRHEQGLNNSDRTGKVTNDHRVDWTAAYELFPGDVAYVWHAGLFAGDVARHLQACKLQVRSQIVWRKIRFAISRGHYHWQHEPCWYAVRDGRTSKWCGDRSQSTVWDIEHKGQDTDTVHGTQKPIECMGRPVRNHGSKDDAVYDPFLGSGTTLIACEQFERRCFGMEIDPVYCDVVVQRWETLTGGKARRTPATAEALLS